MRPTATPEQEELRFAVRDFCAREVTPDRLQTWETTADGADPALRAAVAALGWLGLGAPVSAGGSGASLTDVALLVAECARGLVPRSVLGVIRGVVVLASVAPGSAVLPELLAGRKRLAIAFDEEGARRPESFETKIESTPTGDVVRGAKAYVPDAKAAEFHLVAGQGPDGAALVLVDAGAGHVRLQELKTFGGDRQAHVDYDGATVREALGGGAALFLRVQRTQEALALAEMVGGMEAVLDATVDYAKEREQFGQKIALFQAVRHQLADMSIRLSASRHLAWRAITRVDAGKLEGHEVESALAYVGRSFRELCVGGHHIHGGAGFVVEHPLRFHSERAQSLAVRYAPEAPALEAVARALLD
ncbi:MAG: acyl-CoA dehydrogenase family protein [Candidatus Binatia bacterium]|nr:acyl-CoA dehydrogenase family protein [Candidatus Binatia bacterium]